MSLLGRLMRVDGHSMSPTLKSGELILVSRRRYAARVPQRGDIVVAAPTACGRQKVVKRLAGIPGDEMVVGERVWRLGADDYFLLGDERFESIDSRTFGPIRRQELLGNVWARVWPFTVWRTTPRRTIELARMT